MVFALISKPFSKRTLTLEDSRIKIFMILYPNFNATQKSQAYGNFVGSQFISNTHHLTLAGGVQGRKQTCMSVDNIEFYTDVEFRLCT